MSGALRRLHDVMRHVDGVGGGGAGSFGGGSGASTTYSNDPTIHGHSGSNQNTQNMATGDGWEVRAALHAYHDHMIGIPRGDNANLGVSGLNAGTRGSSGTNAGYVPARWLPLPSPSQAHTVSTALTRTPTFPFA